MTSGDNLYPAVETRIYATDRKFEIHAPHTRNNDRGLRSVTNVDGAFAAGLAALDDLPAPVPRQTDTPVGPGDCCHVFFQRDYVYFDGARTIPISEAVWRQAAGIPPFMDAPIPAR